MPTTSFYCQPNADGYVLRDTTSETFSNIRTNAGNIADNTSVTLDITLNASLTTNQYSGLSRSVLMFDTSALGAGAVIDSATLSIYGQAKSNGLGLSAAHAALSLVATSPSSTSTIVASDYGTFSTTKLATDIAFDDFSTSGYNTYTLNASGLANISKTGVSKFGLRLAVDNDAGTPAWVSGDVTYYVPYATERSGTSQDPVLSITYHYNEGEAAIEGSSSISASPSTVQRIESNPSRKVFGDLLVSWKRSLEGAFRYFTIGVSTIGGNDPIKGEGGTPSEWNRYQYFDESEYVMEMDWERQLKMPTGGITVALADGTLSNTSGRFTPRYMGGSGELFTAILPKRPFIINAGFNYDGIDNPISQFVGVFTRQPEVDYRNKTLSWQGADFNDFLSDKFVDDTAMYTGQRTDQLLEIILQDSLGLATSQYELDTGINNIPFALFERGDKYVDIIDELVQAEYGHFYQDEEGVLRFENRQHWSGSPHTDVSRDIFTAQVIDARAPNDDHIINVVEVKAGSRKKEPEQTIYKLNTFDSIQVDASSTKELFVDFEDPILSLTTPTSSGTTSFYKANSEPDGLGTDMTASITITRVDAFAKAAKFTFNNSSPSTVYITQLNVTGRPAKIQKEIYFRDQDDSSVTAFDEKVYSIENKYIQEDTWAQSLARLILDDFSSPENLQNITIRAIPALKLGDLITWQGRYWRIFGIKTILSMSQGFLQELTLLQRTVTSYFRIGISTIGGSDRIAP